MEETITDPIIELLAITLHQNDFSPGRARDVTPWMQVDPEDREIYREMARGKAALPYYA